MKFNSHLDADVPSWVYVSNLKAVIADDCFNYLCAYHNNVRDICWRDIYKQTCVSLAHGLTEFTHWLFEKNSTGDLYVVGTIKIFLKDERKEVPQLREDDYEGRLIEDILNADIAGINPTLVSAIKYFITNTKMPYFKFAKEWNRQANDGDDFMVFKSKDNFYRVMSHKLCIKKADIYSYKHHVED